LKTPENTRGVLLDIAMPGTWSIVMTAVARSAASWCVSAKSLAPVRHSPARGEPFQPARSQMSAVCDRL